MLYKVLLIKLSSNHVEKLIMSKAVPLILSNDFIQIGPKHSNVNEEEQEHATKICILFQLHRAIDPSHVRRNYILLYRQDSAYPRKDVIRQYLTIHANNRSGKRTQSAT